MADGHLNKCKDCTKKDVHNNYERISLNEEWVEKERARGREKFKRCGYVGRSPKTRNDFFFSGISTISKQLRNLGYDTKGKEAHHWNYNFPHSVFLMSRKAHHRIHLAVVMSRQDKCCYTNDGVKLETSEQAKDFYESVLMKCGLNETIQLIEY